MLQQTSDNSPAGNEFQVLPELRPLEVPRIAPLTDAAHRPFWSVMIPTYNRPHFLEQTLKSVLRADPGRKRMQIQVVDNCSTVGDIESLVKTVGGGRVEYFRQARNLGHHGNGLTCLQRSRGQWVHLLHDDDLVEPEFYAAYERLIARYPDAALLIGPSIHVDENLNPLHMSQVLVDREGPVSDFAPQQAVWNQVSTPAAVVPRRIYEQVGGYPRGMSWTADWEMWFRAGSAGPVITTTVPYALYRMHNGSDTLGNLIAEKNITESIRMIDLLCDRLGPEHRALLPRNRYHRLALSALYYAHLLLQAKHFKATARQLQWAFRLDQNPKTYFKLVSRWLSKNTRARECRRLLEQRAAENKPSVLPV